MTRKGDPASIQRMSLTVTLMEAQERVLRQIERGAAAPNESINENEEARRWYDFTSELLRQISSTDELRDEFTGVGSFDTDITTGKYLRRLRSIYDRLELLPVAKSPAKAFNSPKAGAQPDSRRVFVVHGHDDGLKEAVARFLTKLELEPVILHEQPNLGRTVIEKFETNSDVVFSLVLLTPDDVGHPASNPEEARPRARQNVILELGFFLGTLGRGRVCVLYKGGVDIPSDYSGMLYEEVDTRGAWRLRIAKEMKSAGIEIDLNKAI